jgi:adhesin/invasin
VKTISLKKVSAVAVASLGFGLLSVVPANAATITVAYTYTATTGGVDSKAGATPGLVGSAVTATPTVTTSGTVLTAALTPMVTTFTVVDPNGTDLTSGVQCTAGADVPAEVTGITVATGTCAFNYTLPVTANTDAGALGTIVFTPAMAGQYTIKASSPALTTTDTVSAVTAAVSAGAIFVAGAGVTVSSSGKSTAAGGAVTGGIAKALFAMKAHAADSTYNLTSSGVGTIQTVIDGTGGGLATVCNVTVPGIAGATDYTQGAAVTCAADTFASAEATLASTVAGVQTLTWTAISASTGAPTVVSTLAITWGAAPVLSAGLSTAFLCAGAVTTCAADVSGGVQSINTARTAAANAAASIKVTTANSAGTSLTATQTITATVSGPGTLAFSTDNNNVDSQGRALTGVAGNNMIAIFGDGTSGTSTITITQGTTVIATKTVTFFGAVATLTAKQNHKIASTAGATLGVGTAAPTSADIANTPAVVLTAKDALGNAVPGLTITALSSDATVMSSGITVAGVTATPGNYNAAVTSVANTSGKTATLTFRVMSGTTVLAASAPVTYTLGGSVATVALSLDKTSYSAGAPAAATLTLKDSSGNAAFDADHTTILDSALATSLSVVKALQFNATTNTTVSSLGGVSTVAFNAPGTATTAWIVSGTTGAGPSVDKAKALSVTASVTDATAALITQIDALNAKIVALNALIAKIMKKLGVK